jgi:DNA topoisomerase VI B subunit
MSKQEGTIHQGSIAEFMRKRTQLVGFEFGLNKHTQYAIEFVDNALDAIESFQWKEMKKYPDNNAFLLKDDMLLENFSYLAGGVSPEDIERVEAEQQAKKTDDEGNLLSDDGEIIIPVVAETHTETDTENLVLDSQAEAPKEEKSTATDDEEAAELRKLQKKEQDLEAEVQTIMDGVNSFLFPIQALIEREPYVLIQMTESEAPSVYKDTKDSKDVYQYTFEIFDNGTGMTPGDLEKFGKYLASSKSQKLKQTRGSQGFGSPSAFSDAQNTSGQPITVISKHRQHIYGICSEFFTTSKNNKEYVVPPTEVETCFSHGTYIKLNYLNVKYKRGYVDDYVNLTALTNPHVNLIFIDPTGAEIIYPRRVNRFPAEPTYALPHPSSVNIGDFQDLLRSSENITLSAFLQENFVRLSSSVAKKIIEEAEAEMELALKIFNLGEIYLSHCQHPQEQIYLMRFEQRIFGRNKKPYPKLIPYLLETEPDKEKYWELVTQYNNLLKEIDKSQKKYANKEKDLNKEVDKKKIKEFEKELKDIEKEIIAHQKLLDEMHKTIAKTAKQFSFSHEIQEEKIVEKMEELVNDLILSKVRPKNLNQRQTEAFFKAFKNQKYMSPPTDTAIPIGASVLETTMIKEYKLNLSHRTDLFMEYNPELTQLTTDEYPLLTPRILYKFNKPEFFQDNSNYGFTRPLPEGLNEDKYTEIIAQFDALHTTDDDFVAGHTRMPTSGKGLAFVVEAVAVLSPKIGQPKQPNQVLMRFVNRTPKLRDNSDCAIWKAVQSVNWKNYKIDTFDNGIPKAEMKLIINVAGPYVHLMFKSQSKNALAEDDILMKEIKFCLEVIGRKIRNFENKKVRRETSRKRSKTIEKYIPLFVNALVNIANHLPEYKSLKPAQLEQKLIDGLAGKYDHLLKKEEEQEEATEEEPTDEDEDYEESGDDDDEDRPKRHPKIKEKDEEDTESSKPIADEEEEDASDLEIESEDVSDKEIKQPIEVESPIVADEISKEPKSDVTIKEIPKSKAKVSSLAKKTEKPEKTEKKIPQQLEISTEKPTLEIPPTSAKLLTQESKSDVSSIKEKPTIPPKKEGESPEQTIPSTVSGGPKQVRDLTSILSDKKKVTPEPDTIKKPSLEIGTPKSGAKKSGAVLKESKKSTSPQKQLIIGEPTSKQAVKPPLVVTPSKKEEVVKSTPPAVVPKPSAPAVESTAPKLVKPQSTIKLPTNDEILTVFKKGEWLNFRDILARMSITDPNVARYVQLKLQNLQKETKLKASNDKGKSVWSLS